MENTFKETDLIRFTKSFFVHCLEHKQMPAKSSILDFQFLYYNAGELMKKTYKEYGLNSTLISFIILHKGNVVFKTQSSDSEEIFNAYNSCANILDKI